MNTIEKYNAMFQMLLDGTNPHTGENLPDDNLYCHPDMMRALHYALIALNGYREKDNGKQKPLRAGEPWSQDDDESLETLFINGNSISEIAHRMGRTEGAIESRLVRIGLVKNRYEASAGYGGNNEC